VLHRPLDALFRLYGIFHQIISISLQFFVAIISPSIANKNSNNDKNLFPGPQFSSLGHSDFDQ